ncbi:endo alpha-1,4 polygalactosaminidase [Vibrio tritonius]|uniref:endo alpha-1,4 polygalactosaminidase n=1 Tax=Vibrio tritonius TaxID=1435069 RepID=UPI00083927CD|nr:endo alpha-1,4 polygalactosaminidase [Vibrio tritonius]
MRFRLLSLANLLFLVGCNSAGGGDISTDNHQSTWYSPAAGVTWQWQLQGSVNTSYNVTIYDIDLFDSSTTFITSLQAQGRKVICYFSAGSYENWRSDAADFDASDLGNDVDGWPNEQWLNINSTQVRNIMLARLDLAQSKGCDGVEPDNVDGYVNSSGFSLSYNDQLSFNRFLANAAHKRGLAIGLKNDLDQISDLVDYFDFAVNEQCFEFSECSALTPFINANKPVLNAEYLNTYVSDSSERASMCTSSVNLGLSTLVLPEALDDSFRYSCR